MRFFKVNNNSVFVVCILSILFIETASAIPAFARKTNMNCSTCHTAWPALNAFGRQYKEHGYRLGHLESPNKIIAKDLKWDKEIPISVMLVARPYDKKASGKSKNRALHEVELMVAGPMSEKISGFIEIEAEDEVTNGIGFDTGIPSAALTYNFDEAAHIQVSWGSITWFDPYNSYSNHMRMTRGSSAVIDQGFGGADNGGKIKSSRQNFAVYGRPMEKLFYGISLSGDANDSEGVEGDTLTARIAYDVMPSLTIGALSITGTCEVRTGTTCLTNDREYSRTAIDLQSEIADFTINAVYLSAKDDNSTATSEEKNNAYYIQAMYANLSSNTKWVPLLRYDSYETTNGTINVTELTLSLNYYLTENVRGMLELWDRDSDNNANDDDRLTLQIYAAF